ncbi:VWA domain-containing protein [Xanthobacter autotrophicus]|uniref:vWA domain-containing protein n=1 Tax=Xanthobacter autotrophicus TaxID=280 RepID=UPI001E5B3F90|nr:VWA domain-containing protein [Xanthobacter autotrophicus]UDQ88754.1 VWA domain-containing protein [Xanthobacter autotrophicus]
MTTAIAAEDGRLAENIAWFGRALRAAGLKVGPGRILDAVAAVEMAGVGAREDFYWTLHALFVSRHEDSVVFDQAFRLFWRRRAHQERLIAMLSPVAVPQREQKRESVLRRVEEALFAGVGTERQVEKPRVEVEARLSASVEDVLRTKDFAQMSAAELAEARRRIAHLRMPDDRARTRRLVSDPKGRRLDLRASLRAAVATGGDLVLLKRRGPKEKPPPVVALVDISGSMADYSRPILSFLHALGGRRKVSVFLFGTRLTNVTRQLARRDPDAALAAVSASARDWAGGTRIAASLRGFNVEWSRRVTAQNPVVLLFTDGLEREVDETLAGEMARLKRSCRRLVWLNPLLRYEGFEPKAQGVAAMLPQVDEMRPVHDLKSLESLVSALSGPLSRRSLLPPAQR